MQFSSFGVNTQNKVKSLHVTVRSLTGDQQVISTLPSASGSSDRRPAASMAGGGEEQGRAVVVRDSRSTDRQCTLCGAWAGSWCGLCCGRAYCSEKCPAKERHVRVQLCDQSASAPAQDAPVEDKGSAGPSLPSSLRRVKNALDSPEHQDGVEDLDPSELQAQEEEEEGANGEEGEVGGWNGAANTVSIDLLHWAATVVIQMKHWLNNSRRVLAGRRRLAPVTVERFTTAHYFVGGLLMAAALVTVLVVLFPGASNGYDLMALWQDMCNNPPEFITFRGGSLPPPM